MPIEETKAQFRERLRAARAKLDDVVRQANDVAICKYVIAALSEHPENITVGSYVATNQEPDLRCVYKAATKRNMAWALPRVVAKNTPLAFHQMPEEETAWKLETHPHYKVEQPEESYPEVVPEVLLVPLVGFDDAAHRLGMGGGYYDRTIEALEAQGKKPYLIGVAYHCQKVAAIPEGEHDQTLDCIITELGVINPSEKG